MREAWVDAYVRAAEAAVLFGAHPWHWYLTGGLWAVAALPVSATVTMSHAHDGGDGGCGGNGGGGGEGHVTTTLPLTQFGLS